MIQDLAEEIHEDIKKFDFVEVLRKVESLVKDIFCDLYLEATKLFQTEVTYKVMIYGLGMLLKIVHPILPFVSEEIWDLYGFGGLLAKEKYPGKI